MERKTQVIHVMEFAMHKLLDTHQVCEILNIDQATLRRGVAAGCLPKPIRVGRRGIRWRANELQKWIDSQSGIEYPVKESQAEIA